MADVFKKGPSTHKTAKCGACGHSVLVPKERAGKRVCPCCRGVSRIARSEEK